MLSVCQPIGQHASYGLFRKDAIVSCFRRVPLFLVCFPNSLIVSLITNLTVNHQRHIVSSAFFSAFSSSSSPGGCVEHDWGVSWQRAQYSGPQRRDQRVAVGDHPLLHLLPAEQASTYHPPDQCRAVHWPAAQLHGGHLRQVRAGMWQLS